MHDPHAINIITLGCSKNLVDSEVLAGQLKRNNIKVYFDDNSYRAQTVIINTCGFIIDAKQESIDTILNCIQAKERGDIQQVYVIGCLSERYKNELAEEIKEVDQYFGVDCLQDILEQLLLNYNHQPVPDRTLSKSTHYAYLKISEGCNKKCSFCAIPLIRGKHISKPMSDIIEEAKMLHKKGVKELILIAQDLTYYGFDIHKTFEITQLVDKLASLELFEWIRLHYAYPIKFPLDLLDVMLKYPSVCNYLDMPFQHINTEILRSMHRGNTSGELYKLVDTIRKKVPDIALRTTLMTGFPGETNAAFTEMLEFVTYARFDRLGVFTYSEEEGTWAAQNLNDDIPAEIKQERADMLMQEQMVISNELNKSKIGKRLKVLIDRREDAYFVGRTEHDSPEIDQEVLIFSPVSLKIGEFYTVEIINSSDYELSAKIFT